MDQERIGKFIKDLREKHGLTQREFADGLMISAQAVSKWEHGLTIPDVYMLTLISQKYHVNIDEILTGQKKRKRNNKIYIIPILLSLFLLIGLTFFFMRYYNSGFKVKEVTSACEEYKLTGIVAYNKKKSSLYITNIEYCGPKNEEVYSHISYTLYEEYNDTIKKLSEGIKEENKTIEEFIKTLELKIDDIKIICQDIEKSSLYLEIKALAKNGLEYTHKIPLKFKEEC